MFITWILSTDSKLNCKCYRPSINFWASCKKSQVCKKTYSLFASLLLILLPKFIGFNILGQILLLNSVILVFSISLSSTTIPWA